MTLYTYLVCDVQGGRLCLFVIEDWQFVTEYRHAVGK